MSYFDNNPFMNMFKQLSPEAQQDYEQKGKDLYEYINFETGELYDKPSSYMDKESIQRLLSSGLSIDDLTEEERKILNGKD